MKFWIYLKSYSDYPDWEEEAEFKTKKQALNYWNKKLNKYGYTEKIIRENLAFDKNGKCERFNK